MSGNSRHSRYFPSYDPEKFIRLDPDWINLETLRLWLEVCDKNHGPKCKYHLSGSSDRVRDGGVLLDRVEQSSKSSPQGFQSRISTSIGSSTENSIPTS